MVVVEGQEGVEGPVVEDQEGVERAVVEGQEGVEGAAVYGSRCRKGRSKGLSRCRKGTSTSDNHANSSAVQTKLTQSAVKTVKPDNCDVQKPRKKPTPSPRPPLKHGTPPS